MAKKEDEYDYAGEAQRMAQFIASQSGQEDLAKWGKEGIASKSAKDSAKLDKIDSKVDALKEASGLSDEKLAELMAKIESIDNGSYGDHHGHVIHRGEDYGKQPPAQRKSRAKPKPVMEEAEGDLTPPSKKKTPADSLKKDVTEVKATLKSINVGIKSGNSAQIKVLDSISKKLDEAKKLNKEKSANKSSSSANIVEKLLTTTNTKLTQLIGSMSLLSAKLGRQNIPRPTEVLKPIELPESEEESETVRPNISRAPSGVTKKPYRDGIITKAVTDQTSRLLGRGPAELVRKGMNATGRLASSLVSREQLERIQMRAETKKWRVKVLELLGGKGEGGGKVVEKEKDEISTLKKVLLGGLGVALAAALAAAFFPKFAQFLKDAYQVAKGAATVVNNIPTTFENMGKPGEEYTNSETGLPYKATTTTGKILQGLGNAAIQNIRGVARGVAATVANVQALGTPGQENVNQETGEVYKPTSTVGKITQGIGNVAITGIRTAAEGVAAAVLTLPKLTKDMSASIERFGKAAIDLPEKLAGKLATGAENLANALYNSLKKAGEILTSESTEEKHPIEEVLGGKKKNLPPVSASINKPQYSDTVRALDASSNLAEDLLQKERDKQQQQAPIIIDNSKTNNIGGGQGGDSGSGIRLPAKNNDPSKYMLDRIGNTGGNLGQGFISL